MNRRELLVSGMASVFGLAAKGQNKPEPVVQSDERAGFLVQRVASRFPKVTWVDPVDYYEIRPWGVLQALPSCDVNSEHPLVCLLKNPNPVDIFFDLMCKLVTTLENQARAELWVVPNAFGVPCELWVPPVQHLSQVSASELITFAWQSPPVAPFIVAIEKAETYEDTMRNMDVFNELVLNPCLAMLGREFTKYLASRFEHRTKISIRWEPVLPKLSQAQISEDIAAIALPINEIRAMRGLKPRPLKES